jgi:O-antigen ligase
MVVAFSGRDLKTSLPYSVYEHAVSIFDPTGTGTYVNGQSGDPGGNNRFRLIWWRDVVEDTLAKNPIMGLGFGSDLSTRFLADYDLLSDENFAARDPHSIIVSVIGRMGLAGLAAWILVSVATGSLVWRLLRDGGPDARGLASVVTVIWLSACFGVVLEGPMGAVVFWTVLGLASAQARPEGVNAPVSPEKRCTSTGSGEWPVANAGVLGSESATR